MRGLKFLLALAFAAGPALGAPAASMKPDPRHIPFTLPGDIKWTLDRAFGDYQSPLFGDQNKPGLYGILIKWLPGHFSTPHFHATDRYVYVVSGTWWVSDSDHYDPARTYPLPAGTFATDLARQIHWDGSKTGTTILLLVGMGPAETTKVGAKK